MPISKHTGVNRRPSPQQPGLPPALAGAPGPGRVQARPASRSVTAARIRSGLVKYIDCRPRAAAAATFSLRSSMKMTSSALAPSLASARL